MKDKLINFLKTKLTEKQDLHDECLKLSSTIAAAKHKKEHDEIILPLVKHYSRPGLQNHKLALEKIQWITASPKFTEYQQIELGDAISSFYDCICELQQLKENQNREGEVMKLS